MKYYERCGDCGGDIKERKISKRERVCDECWERRGWVVNNHSKIVERFGLAEFQKMQRVMGRHSGTARRRIKKWQLALIT